MMIQPRRKLSRSFHPRLFRFKILSLKKYCMVLSFVTFIYLNFRFTSSKISGSLQEIPPNPESHWDDRKHSARDKRSWFEQKPLYGSYRYSSIATIHLPTFDLEHEQPQTLRGITSNEELPPSDQDDFIALTKQGYKMNFEDGKKIPNQDRILILSKNDGDWWMGLFDGHGQQGHVVSEYASKEFANRVHREWEKGNRYHSATEDKMKDILRQIYLEINRSIPNPFMTAGCTGISLLKRGNSLFLSNLGDSVAFVGSFNKVSKTFNIIYSTSPHKPDIPSERTRIEAAGGKVSVPTLDGSPARLIIPVKVGNDQIVEIGLAMSRSLGDHDGLKVGLSEEPDTDVLDLTRLDKSLEYIVVAATDGLIDHDKLSESFVGAEVAETFSLKTRSGIEVARELIQKASKIWGSEYRDDISIVALKLTL